MEPLNATFLRSRRVLSALRYGLLGLVVGMSATMASAHEYYAPGFTMVHPWAAVTEPGQADAPVYFKLIDVAADDRLVRAVSPISESVEFRTSPEGPAVRELPISQDSIHQFAPGQFQILLRQLKTPLKWGYSYPLMMVFEKAGIVNVMFFVGDH